MLTKDLLVVGGGVNGTGIARDAAGRGLRYLENHDFRLVRHALKEREVLLQAAPHIIWPLRFVLPHHRALRSEWLIRLGLFLYDYIGGRKQLPPSRRINLKQHPAGPPLKPEFSSGFEYSDCWVQDSRLVVLNAMDAQILGAEIRTRTRCIGLQRQTDYWIADLWDKSTGNVFKVRARGLVNAAGPWVERLLRLDDKCRSDKKIRLVKGSHIVVPRLFDHPYPYIFQHRDGRVLFAIPFERNFTLLGTTDHEVDEIPNRASITEEEITYICRAANEYLNQPVIPEDVVWSYSGVRPLYDDAASSASKVTRDYMLDLDTTGAPILSVFGGKITTHRELAQEAIALLAKPMNIRNPDWTAGSHLPGGDIKNGDFDEFLAQCRKNYPWLPDGLAEDYARNYGTRILNLLNGCRNTKALGRHFGGPLYEREVRYLMESEFARTAEDVLWRRSKKGLLISAEAAANLDEWMAARL